MNQHSKWHPKILEGQAMYTQELFKFRHDNPTQTYWGDIKKENEKADKKFKRSNRRLFN